MRGNDAFEFFYKWRCHVEWSETSLFIHAAAIDPEMTRDSSFPSE
jgi:hypothetical protein